MTNDNRSIPISTALPSLASVGKVPLLDVGRGNAPLKEEIMDAFSQIYDSGRFIGGPYCQNLEQSVAAVCDASFGVGCASGSDALLLALMAIGIEPGDEVILPSFTFFATASAVTRLGAVPVFCDIDPQTYNMDPSLIEGLVTTKTKAIIPVHLFGQCCDMQPILDVAREHKLDVIEDCAQSIGADYKGRPAGSMGRIGCFSFYPTKNLGGMGDGGMLTSNCEETADRLRLLANHGMRPRYYHQEVGVNSRLDAMQAAVLCVKMKHVESYGTSRAQNAARYQKLMIEAGLADQVVLPSSTSDSCHVWNQYTIRIPNGWRDNVRQQLNDANVGTEIYYPIPLHQQVCFSSIPVDRSQLHETEKAAAEVLALPIFPELRPEEQVYVVDCLSKAMQSQVSEYRKAS
ncbi:MAG: DegT/DnrJ/EryC1/StrS family aminotransferase [Planctomycetota bacterium]